jgi:hypothetical protein
VFAWYAIFANGIILTFLIDGNRRLEIHLNFESIGYHASLIQPMVETKIVFCWAEHIETAEKEKLLI